MITVKDAKLILSNLINKLECYDDNAEFLIEIYDNFGGTYLGDISRWTISTRSNIMGADDCGEIFLEVE